MTFCPNKNLPEWKALVANKNVKYPYTVWNDTKGNVEEYIKDSFDYEKINEEKAKNWLSKTFPGKEVKFYNIANQIGNRSQHGYVANAAINIWRQAEVGTEFHEGYHLMFRTMLSEKQREGLYKEALKMYGKPTAAEVEDIKKEFPEIKISDQEASNLVLEEKMATDFRTFMLSEKTSATKGILQWFQDLLEWIKAIISNDLTLRQTYSLLKSNNVNKTLFGRGVLRNSEKMQSNINPNRYRDGIPSAVVDELTDGLVHKVIDEINDRGDNVNMGSILGNTKTNGSIVNGLLYSLYSFPKENPSNKTVEIPILLKSFILERETKRYATALKNNPKPEYKQKYDDAVKAFKAHNLANKVSLNNFPAVPVDPSPRDLKLVAETRQRRDYIFDIIENWNGKFEAKTGNTIVPAWRDFVTRELKDFGYVVSSKTSKVTYEEDDTFDAADDSTLEALDGVEEKKHSQVHYAVAISKRLSQRAKTVLRRIPVTEQIEVDGKVFTKNVKNKYITNQPIYHELPFVYKQLLELWADSQDFIDMEIKLKNYARHRPDYLSISTKIDTLPADDRALLFSAFSNTIRDFDLIILGEDSKVINANTLTTQSKLASQWREQAVEVGGQEYDTSELNRALYVKNFDEESEIATFSLKKAKVERIKVALERVQSAISSKEQVRFKSNEDGTPSRAVISLASLIWELGMNLGNKSDIQDTIKNLQNIIDKGIYVKTKSKTVLRDGKDLYDYIVTNGSLFSMVRKGVVNFSVLKNQLTFGNSPAPVIPYFDIEGSGVKFLSELTPLFLSKTSESFVSATGSLMNPTNLTRPLDDIVQNIKRDIEKNGTDALQFYKQDVFVYSNELGLSHLFRHLLHNPEFAQNFKVPTVDAVKDRHDDATDYEDFDEITAVLARIQEYLNNGDKKYCKVVIPAAGDRTSTDFLPMPRIKGHDDPNLNLKSYAEVFQRGILEDFLRIDKAQQIIDDPNAVKLEGYTSGANRGISSEYMQFDGIYENNERIVTDVVLKTDGVIKKMSGETKRYLEYKKNNIPLDKTLKLYEIELKRMTADLGKFYNNMAESLADKILEADRGLEIGKKDLQKWGTLVDKGKGITRESRREAMVKMMKDFLVHEDLGRNEIIKMTRGNRALFKNNDDFTKRQRLLSTPGVKLGIKNTLSAKEAGNKVTWMSESYGADPTFTDFTFLDPRLDITQAIKEAAQDYVSRTVNTLRNMVNSKGQRLYTEEDLKDLYGYNPGEFEETNAFAIISMDFYRSIMQGRGLWKEYHEDAYLNYNKTGRFIYGPRVPMSEEGLAQYAKKLPPGASIGDHVPVLPMKPYFEDLKNVSGVTVAETHKTAYFVALKEHTERFPILDDLRQRLEMNPLEIGSPYANTGLPKISVAHALSAKKTLVANVYDFKTKLDAKGQHVPGSLTDIVLATHDTSKLRFPQIIPESKKELTAIFNRQAKKNAIANVDPSNIYFLNAGMEEDPRNFLKETTISGKSMLAMYHAAIEERINRDIATVNEEIGLTEFKKIVEQLKNATNKKGKVVIDEILKTQEFKDAKLKLMQRLRGIIERQVVEADVSENYLEALNITIDPTTGIPKFSIPLDFPVFGRKFQSSLLSIYNNNVFKQRLPGYEAVQASTLGAMKITKDDVGTLDTLQFLEIVPHNNPKNKSGLRLSSAEIMVREDVLRKFNLPEGEYSLDEIPESLRKLFAYRIPNQDKASMIMFRIKAILPKNHEKSIIVPPQLAQLMGSDFDVDKMFLLFPELEERQVTITNPDGSTITTTVMAKATADYEEVYRDLSKLKGISDAQLNNVMLDTIEAVLSSSHHFLETLSPLDSTALPSIRNSLIERRPELAISRLWTGGEYETQSSIRNLLGVKLRGLWANALAGRNVATNLEVNVFDSFAVKIEGEVINTKLLSKVKNENATYDNNVVTDKIVSRYLSAAVDTTKDPLQYVINDNIITFPVENYWINFFGDTKLLHDFLNQPIIRRFVDIMSINYGSNLTQINNAYRAVAEEFNIDTTGTTLPPNYKDIEKTKSMNRQAITDFKVSPATALSNFMKFYAAGQQLKEFFKVITPDTMDGLNRIESMQAFLERKDRFMNPAEGKFQRAPIAFYGRSMDENVVEQILDEDSAYGLSRGYYKMIQETLDVASILFPMTLSSQVKSFKKTVKAMIGKENLTADMHREVNPAIMFTVLSRPDSPLRVYFDKAYSDATYKPSKNSLTLLGELDNIVKKFPNLRANEFLSKIKADNDNVKFKGFRTLNFDATQQYAPKEKQRIKDDLTNLLYRPEAYLGKLSRTASEEEKKSYKAKADQIRTFGFKIAMHTFISNGFRTSAYNFADLLPANFYTQPLDRIGKLDTQGKELKPISIAEYMHEQSMKMQNSSYFTGEDLIRFFRIFGEIRPGGSNLVERSNLAAGKLLKPEVNVPIKKYGKNVPKILILRDDKGKTDVYIMDDSTYSNKNSTAKYLSLRKVNNNKKHIVGGDFLNIKTIGNDVPINEALSLAQLIYDASVNKESTNDVAQLCML